jgi:hypothetical protein
MDDKIVESEHHRGHPFLLTPPNLRHGAPRRYFYLATLRGPSGAALGWKARPTCVLDEPRVVAGRNAAFWWERAPK